jgi:hypothetical protein
MKLGSGLPAFRLIGGQRQYGVMDTHVWWDDVAGVEKVKFWSALDDRHAKKLLVERRAPIAVTTYTLNLI